MKLTKKEVKDIAKDMILLALEHAEYYLSDSEEYTEDLKEQIFIQMDKQIFRIYKHLEVK